MALGDMKDQDRFIRAYHEFKRQIDLTGGGVLPEVDDLVCYMLMGIPRVPADEEPGEGGPITAVEQRVNILKALFVECNKDRPDGFLDEGLRRYDQAATTAKTLLTESQER